KDGDMKVIASTTDTFYLANGLNKDSTYWLAVRSVMGGTIGRRSIAQPSLLVPGGCTLPVLNYDVTPDSLVVAAHTGRKYTSSQLGAMTPQVHITNLGNVAASGPAAISYQVNGGIPVTETTNINLGIHSNFTYRFSSAYDLSAPGTYTVKAWIKYSNDTIPGNDTTTTIIKHLQNDPVVLNPTYTEGFESAAAQTCYKGTMGFEGLDRCDFNSSTPYGRARTFVNTGMARTGNRAITLDQLSSCADSLIATFNLANYSTTGQVWLSLYAKNQGITFSAAGNKVWIRGSDQDAWIPVYTLPYKLADTGVYSPMPPVNITETLGTASPAQTLTSSFQIKMGEEGNFPTDNSSLRNGYTYDDVTFTLKNDAVGMMQIVNPYWVRCSSGPAEPVTIKIRNYGPVTLTNVPVSYQVNSNTPVTENITAIAPFATINYTFNQTADLSQSNQYNIKAWTHYNTDSYPVNDTISETVYITNVITNYPYLEGFEGANSSWFTAGINSSWQCGKPSGAVIKNAANGNKAWITGINSGYNNNELSYLYSPCFDLSPLTQPVLSFSHIYDMQDNGASDHHWVEYSTDGQIWKKLGNFQDGVNWYQRLDSSWAGSFLRWHVSSFDIPATGATIRFRIVFQSDSSVTREGIGIDDVHIFDKASIYEGDSLTSGIIQPVSGNHWIDFTSDMGFDPGMKLIASINANGQDLGNTEVKVYPNDFEPCNDGYQYYLGRNIVIRSTNKPTAPVKVRFYITEDNIWAMYFNANDCNGCIKLSSAYDAGITQYSNAPSEEDGSLANNKNGIYRFISPSQVDIIPYDKGYYAEFEVTGFSEFWLSSVPPPNALPMVLGAFTATNNKNTALLEWLTYSESNTSQFVIERSTNGTNYIPAGTLAASGSSSSLKNYRFTDYHPEPGKNYYRIRLIDIDGKFSYSPTRIVTFADNNFTVDIKPNPVTQGTVFINSTANCNRIELRDGTGRLIRSVAVNGMQTQLPVQHLTKGLYFLTVITDQGKKVEKLIIQ
ncbi:MAG: T9SS type A sorting domain-containing protein, partial [Niastella sp.]|uniref:T9SS type A sorting domain-containing protein n=1 Tax=Niastella sp. TaxID=1869183 RepID=UPI00389A3644